MCIQEKTETTFFFGSHHPWCETCLTYPCLYTSVYVLNVVGFRTFSKHELPMVSSCPKNNRHHHRRLFLSKDTECQRVPTTCLCDAATGERGPATKLPGSRCRRVLGHWPCSAAASHVCHRLSHCGSAWRWAVQYGGVPSPYSGFGDRTHSMPSLLPQARHQGTTFCAVHLPR